MRFLLELHTRGDLLFQSIYGKLVNPQGFHMYHLPDYFIQLFHNRNSHLEVRIFDALRMSDLHHNYLMTYAKTAVQPIYKLFYYKFLTNRVIIIFLKSLQFSLQFLGDIFSTRLTINVIHFGRIFLQVEKFP